MKAARLARAAIVLPVAWLALRGMAAPFVPLSDAEIVETLRERPLDAEDRAARRLRQEARSHPQNLPMALRAARIAIGRARRDGDPRELGQAQAALAPWWALADPPPAVRLLRATVLQSQHAFAPALADLDRLLALSTAPVELQAQAELTRASLLQVQGRYVDAARGCERLASGRYEALGPGVAWTAQVCAAELQSLRGHADEARRALAHLAHGATSPEQSGWLALVRAELAERMNDAHAENFYRQALASAADARPDVYTLGAYADWLLDHARPSEAAQLLAGREAADALLLRLALAWHQTHDPRADAALATLRARFDAARLRGDALHRREEARMRLQLLGDPAGALRLAAENWALQKEPADTRLLLEAAAAASQPAAAEPVRHFMRDTGYVDVRTDVRMAKGSP